MQINKLIHPLPMPPVSLLGILSSGTAHATFLQHDPTFPTCPRGSRQHHNHHRRQHHSTPRGGHVLALQPTPRHHKKVCGVTFGECVRVCVRVCGDSGSMGARVLPRHSSTVHWPYWRRVGDGKTARWQILPIFRRGWVFLLYIYLLFPSFCPVLGFVSLKRWWNGKDVLIHS